jgi:hypothetical protein
MPCVGLEPTIPASEQEKTVHALDRPATVTDALAYINFLIFPACYIYGFNLILTLNSVYFPTQQ